MLEETSQIPARIEWDVFARFLSLFHKYNQELGGKPLEQAKI